jgi:hypothetical protein
LTASFVTRFGERLAVCTGALMPIKIHRIHFRVDGHVDCPHNVGAALIEHGRKEPHEYSLRRFDVGF